VNKLSVETPASFVGFDLLAEAGTSLMDAPFSDRRAALEHVLARVTAPIHLSQTTQDAEVARRWLVEFEGAGLDGVIAKPLAAVYEPGKRTMLKIKHSRTADVVLIAYRIHKSGQGVGSLLLGLYTDDGQLLPVGGASAFSNARRLELIDELEPLVERDESGEVVTGEGERSRFSASKDVSFVKLRPERVIEVKYDQMEGWRFRHAVQFLRWRDDRDPRSCTYDQLEAPTAYDLSEVLS
jgi:ATP-dependent DNA ligase